MPTHPSKLADKPTRFHVENFPTGNYLLIPSVSSENRQYIPIGFMNPDDLASNLVFVVPNATLYHFGILTSSIHMAWLRTVGGRLKSDYRYSKDIVYNNFVWCEPSEKNRTLKLNNVIQFQLSGAEIGNQFPVCRTKSEGTWSTFERRN